MEKSTSCNNNSESVTILMKGNIIIINIGTILQLNALIWLYNVHYNIWKVIITHVDIFCSK